MKKSSILLTIMFLTLCHLSFAQYYYFPRLDAGTNPGNLNNDAEITLPGGWTNILATRDDTSWSAIQTIPFDFEFNGDTVTEYIVAHSGVLTFSTSSTSVPSTANTSLPSTEIPDSSICIWGIENSGSDDIVYTKTFGSSPNRQHWIMFNSFSAPGSSGTNWTYWSIVLEETTNKIYLVDMRTRRTPLSLTLGIQIDANSAYQVSGSPNITNRASNSSGSVDNTYYEFIQGTQPNIDLSAIDFSVTPFFPSVSSREILISGTFENLGSQDVQSFDFNYSVDGGPVQSSTITTNLISGGILSIDYPDALNPTNAGDVDIEIWASNINSLADGNTSNDTLSGVLTISDSIPNFIDSISTSYGIELVSVPSDRLSTPTDLDFHPELKRKELWVINRRTRPQGGATVTYSNVGESNQTSEFKVDGNAWHFMALPSGIAFSDNGNFANSASIFNANSQTGDGGSPFTGPALWSSDPAIYAVDHGTNGSHYDMLHESPYTMGIAHEVDNAFWVYDGYSGDIVRYDFVEDHGPGNDDHSDGRISRYPVPVSTINNSDDQEVPCHLILDKETNWLYIADQQAGEILRLDITSGTSRGVGSGNLIFQQTEPLAEYIAMTNITWERYIDDGLVQPSGIEIVENRLLVSDYANGNIMVYDISSSEPKFLSKIETNHAGIAGIKVGPEGNIWFVNALRNELSVIKPIQNDISIEKLTFPTFPNIADASITISGIVRNNGRDTVNSFDISYSIDGGTDQVDAINSEIAPGEEYHFEHSILHNLTSVGTFPIEVSTELNNLNDEVSNNDQLSSSIVISDAIPNIIDNILDLYKDTLVGDASDGLDEPKDLAFHPDLNRLELWVVNQKDEQSGGSTVTYFNAGEMNQSSSEKQDEDAVNSMALPVSIAFSDNGNFATAPSVLDADYDGGDPFTGPTLWNSDASVYANSFEGNGSSIDKLRQSPYSMGIAHESHNVFWNFDGFNEDIVRYDFALDNEPGDKDYSDGRVRRYPVPVKRIDGEIPSHLKLDKSSGWLYIVDGGNARVLRLNTNAGTIGNTPTFGPFETLAEYVNMDNIEYEVYLDSGLTQPSGIEIIGNRLLISDYSSGHIKVYELGADEPTHLGDIKTRSGGIAGITVGPKGNIWYVNDSTKQVRRIIPAPTSIKEVSFQSELNIYPNPTTGLITLDFGSTPISGIQLMVINTIGQTIIEQNVLNNKIQIDLTNLENGIYFVNVVNGKENLSKKIIVNK